ncbi:hypothetical protein GQ457_01G020310 [Hibiscus cannabinus]
MHGELGAPEEDPASLISVADRITVTVTEFSNATSITDRWRNKEDRALGSSDCGELAILISFGVGISSRSRVTVSSNCLLGFGGGILALIVSEDGEGPNPRFICVLVNRFPSLPLPKTPSPHTLLHRRSSDRASTAIRVIHDSHHGVPLFFPRQLTPSSTRSLPPFVCNGCETVSALSLRPYLHLGRRGCVACVGWWVVGSGEGFGGVRGGGEGLVLG